MSNSRSIPFFNYPHLFKKHEAEFIDIFKDVCSRGAYILQKDTLEFEKNLAHFTGAKHAFGVADGSNAITISLIASGVTVGDEVILPSHTYIATAGSVHAIGAKPVLVDCGQDHMICPDSIEKAITTKTRAIIPVQVNGRTANMDRICEIANRYNLVIVEDAAQGLGSKFKGRSAGTFGKAGTISFYPAKLLGSFGDGGAILTNDDEVATKISMLRDHGKDPEGMVRCWGFNCRLDNLQAAILNFKMKTFPEEIERRRAIAQIYQDRLGSLNALLLPPAPNADPDHFDVYQNYEIEAENRDQLKSYLEENGVRTIIQWAGKAIHQFEDLGFKEKPEYTEKMFERCLLLPMNVSLSNEDIEYICDQVHQFYQRS